MRGLLWVLLLVSCKRDPSKIDADGDGVFADEDCNDEDPSIRPGVIEQVYDGVDNDCDVATLDDDLDRDGFVLAEDCDDREADVRPNVDEIPYDGVDNDCDPSTVDDDLDGDGFGIATDCADGNAAINPDQPEIYYDGVDNDCDLLLTIDDDQDRDQVPAEVDCDDLDPLAREPGLYFIDCDGDGFSPGVDGSVASCELPMSPPVDCPDGSWTQVEPAGSEVDCVDSDGWVFPGQTQYFGGPIPDADPGAEYDYDCDGSALPLYGSYSCAMNPGPQPDSFFCTQIPGFLADPGCGQAGDYASGCVSLSDTTCEQGTTEVRVQECR